MLQNYRCVQGTQLEQAIGELIFTKSPVQPIKILLQIFMHILARDAIVGAEQIALNVTDD